MRFFRPAPWSRDLHETWIVSQLNKKFPICMEPKAPLTRSQEPAIARLIHSRPTQSKSLRYTLIIPSHLRADLPRGLLRIVHRNPVQTPLPYVPHAPIHSSWFDHPASIWRGGKIFLSRSFLQSNSSVLGRNMLDVSMAGLLTGSVLFVSKYGEFLWRAERTHMLWGVAVPQHTNSLHGLAV
jgi:hypothetical protein